MKLLLLILSIAAMAWFLAKLIALQVCSALQPTEPRLKISSVIIRPRSAKPQSPTTITMIQKLSRSQEIIYGVFPEDSGIDAKIDGKIRWNVVHNNLVDLYPSESGRLCLVWPNGNGVGLVKIEISADADLGEGERFIRETVELEIVEPEATVLRAVVLGVPQARSAEPKAPEDPVPPQPPTETPEDPAPEPTNPDPVEPTPEPEPTQPEGEEPVTPPAT